MAKTTWNGSNDNWDTPADWTGGVLPGSTSDVVINAGNPQVTTNDGTVASVTVSSTLELSGGGSLTTTGFFTNIGGTVDVDAFYDQGGGGSNLAIGGLLTNTGTFNIGDPYADQKASTTVTVQSLFNTGTINVNSLGTTVLSSLVVQSAAGFGAAGSLTGSINLANDADIVFASGQINDIASSSQLTLANADSYIADVGSTSSNSALTGLANIEGGLTLYAGASITTTGGLTNTGNIYLDTYYGHGGGGSSLTINGLLTNTGSLNIGDAYVDQSKGSTLTVNSLSSSGAISIVSSNSTLLSSLVDKAAAGLGSTGVLTGPITLVGDALLEFGGGQITDFRGNLELDGSKAFVADAGATSSNSALAGLATIEASSNVDLRGATLTTTSAGVANAGTLRIDQNYDDGDQRQGGSNVTLKGALTNTNTVIIGNYNLGASTSASVGAIVNSGTLVVQGDQFNVNGGTNKATLTVTGAAGFGSGAAGMLTGTVDIEDNSAIVFASGQITDVQDSLLLDGAKSLIADALTPASNSALAGLATIEGNANVDLRDATLTTTGGLANAGTLRVDQYYDDGDQQQGGSNVTFEGTLANTGTVVIGGYNLAASTSVSVNAIVNSNAIYVQGDQYNVNGGTNKATLTVGSVAGFGSGVAGTLTGSVSVEDNAAIVFASGEITDVQGSLLLDGSKSIISDATTPASNSALTGLATIEANANVDLRGVTLTTTGGLANGGTLRVDQYYDDGDQQQGGANVTVTGTLTSSGTANLGAYNLNASDKISVGAVNNTGTLNVSGDNSNQNGGGFQSTLMVGSAAAFGTAATLTGNVGVYGNAAITFASGQITDIQGNLELDGSRSFVADAAKPTSNSALSGLATIESGAALDLRGATLADAGGLANAGTLRVDQYYDDGDQQQGGANLAVTGTLTNSGTANLGAYNLNASDHISAGAVNNTGTLNLSGGNSNQNDGGFQSTFAVGSAAGFGPAATLTGNVAVFGNAAITFTSGQITDIQGGLELDGAKSFVADAATPTSNSALAGLATIESTGTLDLRGATLADTGNLANAGVLRVDQYYDDGDQQLGGANLTITGTLSNSGTANLGAYNLNVSDHISVGAVNNTGTLNVSGDYADQSGGVFQSTFAVGGAAGFGTAGILTGNVRVYGNAAITFTSGKIIDIQGGLELDGSKSLLADAATPTSNSALAGLATIEATGNLDLRGATLADTGSLTNAGTLSVDEYRDEGDIQQGGSNVTIKGTFTNSGTSNVGAGINILNVPTRVSAGAVNNTGTINIDSGAAQATLAATGNFENSGSLNVYFDSNISAATFQQDATGEITLELGGTDAAHHATVTTTGGLTLNGGSVNTPTSNYNIYSFAANDTFNLFTFGTGKLVGIFNSLGNQGDGATYNLGNGLLLGLEYDDNLGVIEEKVVTAPTSTADSWTGGSADFGTVADWSNGAPDFFSAVTISTSAAATVSLTTDKTIDSLVIGANDTLSTKTGTDLSIGTTISVAGALTIGGESFVDGVATNNGAVTVNGLLDIRGAVTGLGGFTLGAKAELELGAADSETVTFNGAGATLKLDQPAAFAGKLANLAVGDIIDLAGITVAAPTVSNGTTLNFTDSKNNSYAYTLTGFPGGAGFVAQSDGAGGTELIVTPPATSVTLNPIDGDNVINQTEARAGVTVGGSVSGLANGATFSLNVVDGAVSQTYTATVSGSTWSASLPASGLGALPDGSASFTAVVNASTQASQTVVVHETLPTLTINKIDGNDVIDKAQAQAGVSISGGSAGLNAGATFSVSVVDGTFSKTYTATVGSGGGWSATIPSADAVMLANGTATVSAKATDAYGNVSTIQTQTVTVQQTLPTLTLNAVDGDNVINHAQAAAGLTLSGGSTGLTPGATFTVTLTDGTFSKGYLATVGSGGAWTASVPAADATTLGNGTNALTVRAQATDAYGNVSSAVSETVTVAGNLPSLTISAVDGNNVVNHAQAAAGVAISGTSTGLAQGATFSVSLTDGAFSKSYTATVGAGGAWSASVPAADATSLTDGTASLSAQATDAYGNPSNVATDSVAIHETLPTVTIGQIDGNDVINHAQANAAGGVSLSGGSTGLASGATFSVSVVDGTFSKTYTAKVGAGGAWTATIPEIDAVTLTNGVGAAKVSATATDAYGNVSATASQTVTVEETLPTLTISPIDGDNVINSAQAHAAGGVPLAGTVTGLASGATFSVSVVDGSFSKTYAATVGSGGAWTATIPETDASTLAVGTATVSAQATDAYGNVSATASQSVTVAGNAPTVAISPIDGNDVINNSEAKAGVAISGTSTGLASGAMFLVGVVDGTFSKTYTATVGAGGAWTAAIPTSDATTLANGTATFSAQATDAFGNVSAVATQSVNVQETLPTLTIAPVDGDGVINQAQASAGVAISGTSTGLASGSTFTVGVADGTFSKSYTATVGAGGAWTATIPSADALTLPNGTATVSAQATDSYGNVSVPVSQTVAVQESASVTLNPVDGNNIINYAEAHAAGGVALSGTVAGLASGAKFGVSVADGNFNKTYTAIVGANGAWTATLPTGDARALADGSAVVTATIAPGVSASETVTVAETQPDFTAIAETPAAGDLDAGKSVVLSLTVSEAVAVTGKPTLALNDGGVATYDAAESTVTSLAFDYTVAAGDNTPALRIDAVNLGGATILDADGNAALLSIGGLAQKGPKIDTQSPSFIGLVETPSTGDLGLGKTVTIYLYTSEAVTVTGAPTLALNDGGTATFYAAGTTATRIAFRTTLLAGQSSPDLMATSLNLSGGAILDLAGNPADVSLDNLTEAGPAVSGVAPIITAIAEAPASGDFDAGANVSLSLTISEAVTVRGAPKLTLNDGGTATYDAAKSTATSLVFDYTVGAGQNTASLAVTAVALHGGSILDAYGNATNLSVAGLTQTGPKIDTLAPTFTAVAETPATGDLDAGKTGTIALTASEAVVVVGTPTLTLNDGGTATYDAAKSSATSLVFDYTVAAGQNVAALKVTTVNLAGGTINDLAGNAAKLSLGGLTQTGPQIDTTPPKFTAITETPATGDLDAGKTGTIALKTSEAVVVAGAPTLTLNDGGTASYDAAKSTSTSLVFDYTVAAGQNTAALQASAVNLAGGGILDLAGNAATLSLTGLAQKGPQIDTTLPTFTAVTETPATGDLGLAKTATLAVAVSEAVIVTGAPILILNDGGAATYDAAKSSAKKLVFDYMVGPGQNTAALAAASVSLNGGTILDLAGNAATLSLTGLTQKGPQIDTTAPTVVSVSGTPTSGDVVTGQTEIIKLNLSEAAKVTGTPDLVLSDGGVATYASGSGTNALTFDYKVLAGQQTTDLQLVGSSFGAGSGIADLAGNPLLFPHSTSDLGVGVNNFVTLTGSETYQIAGPSSTDVVFAAGASADLILTDSVGYAGHLSGLGTADTLDFADLAYSPSAQASYAGTATGGTLTVNDGAHQAAISLLGNFLNSTFTLSNDGYGGVNVVDPLRSSLAAHTSA